MAQLFSHTNHELDLLKKVAEIELKLEKAGDTETGPLAEKIKILHELTQFELGRFLLLNQGYNGYWTHFCVYQFPRSFEVRKNCHPLEREILNIWVMDGWRERFGTFQTLLQNELKEKVSMLSVPCGFMADMLTLDFRDLKEYELVGVDLDPNSLEGAKSLAKEKGIEKHTHFLMKDALDMQLAESFDVVCSHGLNMYLPSEAQVLELYRQFYKSLRASGKLIISYLTPQKFEFASSERDLRPADPASIRLQKLIFHEIIDLKFYHYVSTEQMIENIKKTGFRDVKIFFNKYKHLNTLVALK